MAKRGRPKKAPDKEVPLTSAELRAMAAKLADLQEQLEEHAGDMDRIGIHSITPQMQNWHNAVTFQENWISKQLVPKLLSTARDLGTSLRVRITTGQKK